MKKLKFKPKTYPNFPLIVGKKYAKKVMKLIREEEKRRTEIINEAFN